MGWSVLATLDRLKTYLHRVRYGPVRGAVCWLYAAEEDGRCVMTVWILSPPDPQRLASVRGSSAEAELDPGAGLGTRVRPWRSKAPHSVPSRLTKKPMSTT